MIRENKLDSSLDDANDSICMVTCKMPPLRDVLCIIISDSHQKPSMGETLLTTPSAYEDLKELMNKWPHNFEALRSRVHV
jgi:hypothetical protein